MNQQVILSPAVKNALEEGKPILALESTIISHGMPYPQNVETAFNCERIARENGAEPATIAILDGKLCSGLTPEQIEYLGKKGQNVRKVSRRDLPVLIARREDGATTVAATMIVAALAGIQVFATGGVGGVHRNAGQTMDISADLEELAQTPVAVVCAGAKSILDLGLTMEYLETKGVPVIGFQTDELPAFYTRESGYRVTDRAESPEDVGAIICAQRTLGFRGGLLITNPIPQEYALPREMIDSAICSALEDAREQGVSGKEVTPFLLARVVEKTSGLSLKANIQLVYNNVKLAAQIARALRV